MFSAFFINRPILASVIAMVIVLVGLISLFSLPIDQYPDITPPSVSVRTVYPGANAQTVADTVATVIEEQVNGVEDMLYMTSTSANDGSYGLNVTFEVGTDIDKAQVLVQNRVGTATPRLPSDVKTQGVTTAKQSPTILFVITLQSPDGRYDSLFMSNYATLRIADELSRISGVGGVRVFGAADYSMRIWLDPELMKARDLTAADIIQAVQEQNVQVAAGQIGAPPAPPGQAFQYTVTTRGRLTDPDEFGDIILRSEGDRITRLRDVARIELGSQSYDQFFEVSGRPAAGIAIYQLPGSNALRLATEVRQRMDELSQSFPPGLVYDIPYDTTKFVQASIDEVYRTFIEAALLVFLVIFLFLQDLRATVIPAVTIPVSLIGTFFVMSLLGFSINMLTLFGLVLAIGIVVDDAIVVVENVWHHMEHEGIGAREATIRAMREITGPIVAITLVLMSVFLPTSFLPGITGRMYRQFALTIAVSTVISAVNALTLSPALCALILRRPRPRRFVLFRAFNWAFARTRSLSEGLVRGLVRRAGLVMAIYLVLVAAVAKGYLSLPTGFLPTEDQGYCIAITQLPDGASLERTRRVAQELGEALRRTPGIDHWVTVGGLSILDGTSASNAATSFVTFKPWNERTDPGESQEAILSNLRREFGQIQDAIIFPIVPPAIRGLGVAGGFQMELEDRGGAGLVALQRMAEEIVQTGNTQTGLQGLNSTFRASVPQLFVDVDRTEAKTLGVPLTAVFGALQTYLGSTYINDINLFGRVYQVRAQADAGFRVEPDDIRRLEVRNGQGDMVPLGTLAGVRQAFGPQSITRYNMYPAAAITGQAAPGYSSGQALQIMEQLARSRLPASMGFDWTGMSYQERRVGSQAVFIFTLAVLLVFFILAGLYESWTNPVAVVLVVPLALIGTVAAVAARHMDNNIYTQIGVVLIIALASKNAILIVEFARDLRSRGQGLREAAIGAAALRFRPILMTSFAFILGITPLVVARGAAAASREALGTAVLGGMIAATVLAVLFVPVFFVVFQGLSEWFARRRAASPVALTQP